MRKFLSVALIATLVLSLTAFAGATGAAPSSGRGLSIVSMQPDTAQALKAQGRSLPYPFPNSVNKGRKFNPSIGEAVGALTTGATQKVLVLFVDTTTLPPGGPATRVPLTYFDNMLFGTTYDPPEYSGYAGHPTDRTLYNYYKAVSYGAVDVVTLNLPSAMGWVNTGQPYEYYCHADAAHAYGFGVFPENAQGLVRDAVLAADPLVDFSQYAVDGEVPNLFVVHAGTGAEWSSDPSVIWSHSWDLTEGTSMNGLTVDGVKVNNYAIMPEVGGNLTGYYGAVTGPYPPTVGVYAHEYGHVLGLPDQYDYGYESEGTGIYSLMAGGSWNRWPNARLFSGNSPAELDAWSKVRLGLATPTLISSAPNLTLQPAEQFAEIYKMTVAGSNGLEYYLFENRQQLGFDEGFGQFGPDVHGLAIYHIDDNVLTRNYWRPNEAENWLNNRSAGFRRAWTGESHYGISIIQADNRWDLERGVYWTGYAGDLFPGILGKTSFGSNTLPNNTSYYFWKGLDPKFGYSGVTVTGIAEAGLNVTASFANVPWTPPKK